MPKNYCIMQIWAESGKSALPICNYSQILYQFLTFTQNLKRSRQSTPATKLLRRRKKLKKSNSIRASPSLCTYTAVRDFYFHFKLYGTDRAYFIASIISLIPTFMPSSKAVFSHAQHTLPCWSMIFSQSGMSIP